MTILGSSIVAFFAFLMILFGGWFIRLWMGKSFEWQIETLIGLSSLSVFMAVSSPCQMLLNSMGEIKIQIKIWAVFLILSIALKLYLLYFFNFWVVPMITSGLYLCIVIPTVLLHAKKIINQHEVQP
jgi:O-antigen/teichoic acid export membrane protein